MPSRPPPPSPTLRVRSKQLEVEIRMLRAHLDELVAEHKHVQSQLRSIVYPILQIPPEIIAEIFVWCLSGGPKSQAQTTAHLKSVPMQLACVCRDWRNIAFSTPQIWCFVTASLNSNLFYTRPYFTRLGTSPVVPLEVIARYCHQWETVKIDLMDRDAALLGKVKGRLPLLQKLTVSVYGESLGDTFGQAPKLRDLDVTVINTSARALSPTNFPWSQLNVFRGESLSIEDCFQVLRLTPHLECCTFSGWFGDSNGLPVLPLNLPSLRSLSLLNPEQFGWFLGALTLPGLEDLRLSILARQIPSFCEFIYRSSCSLKQLALRTSSMLSYEALSKLWEAVPTVTHIDVSPGIFSDQMTRLLFEQKAVLPNLCGVAVDGKGPDSSTMDYQLLLDMLRSRQHPAVDGPPSSIQSFGFRSSEGWDIALDIVSQFKSMVKERMEIQMDVTIPLHALITNVSL
ncbi:hypothetical protein B0H17DRAFT_1055480 [Mycena rosella]|uniref:F-box domain-containing protein n=1 Tax=Mycena rosella TaxID=1033263 RepID=A0AAD7GM90_MYCRO|nr:hypothetical protein B0H17DRAFT_1055480 [Mycena rosella]